MQLPVSLIAVIMHGHGEGQYHHFSLGLWPLDPNFTIASLSMCFKNLERLERHENGVLVEDGL